MLACLLTAGKAFFKKKKQPVPVRLTGKDWAGQIRKACESTYLFWSGVHRSKSAQCLVQSCARVASRSRQPVPESEPALARCRCVQAAAASQ
jgi:hypothetical protein